MAKYKVSVSSGGRQTTSSPNTVIDITQIAPYAQHINHLQLDAFNTTYHVLLNNETVAIEIDANSTVVIDDMVIFKITIVENAVQYRFTGLVGE